MLERLDSIEQAGGPRQLLPLCPLFALLIAVILFWGVGTMRSPVQTTWRIAPAQHWEEPVPALVTAEQLERMRYVDSSLGDFSWDLSRESLEELNRVLREYGITGTEELSQFLAQAAVETGGGQWLTELGEESYFRQYGYTAGTRGAGYLHLTYEYGQMAFSVWMMKKYIPKLSDVPYVNPQEHTRSEVAEAYYRALRTAANLGVDVSRYSRIVYDPQFPGDTGADYIAQAFAWESAAY